MPYESAKDKELFGKSVDTDTGKLSVKIMSYDGGTKKLQNSREVKDQEDKLKFAKLGRMTSTEVTEILPIIQEAISNM